MKLTKAEYIDDRFDIKGLREAGFLTTEKTYEEIEQRICKWFGLKNIFMYDFIPEEKTKSVKADMQTFSSN